MPSARSQTLLRLSKAVIVVCGFALISLGTNAKAENIRVTEPTDYWYQFDTTSVFSVRTYAVEGYGSDPMLWLYNSEGGVIAANDDWYGLQSNIEIQVEAGWYRLRAGVCCGNPDAWWQGVQYELWTNAVTVVPTTFETTTSSSVESWLDTTTTSNEPPTTVQPTLPETTQPLPTSSSTTTTRPDPTTTTSTTSQPTSTTSTEPSTTTTVSPSSSLTPTSSLTSLPSSSQPTSTAVSTTSPTTTSSVSVPTTVATSLSGNVSTVATTTTTPQTTTSLPIEPSTPDQAIEVLSNVSTSEEAQAAIEAIAANIDNLTAEQLNEIAAAVSKAPVEVKRAFESEVNIFGGGLDSYVPADSNVTVGQRRALVAVGAVMAAAPVLASRRR